MKYSHLLFVIMPLMYISGINSAHAAISNGVAAIDALGQYDDSLSDPQPVYTKSTVNDGPNRLGLNQPFGSIGVDTIHHRLFISDRTNNRILVYNLNSDHTLPDHIADYVLGQPNFYSNTAAPVSASSLNGPMGSFYDPTGNRLFVVDRGNHRVLVYDVSTISNGMSASYVLGQSAFTTADESTTSSSMRMPWGVTYDGTGGLLFVGDSDNNRVLVFSGALSSGMDAWRVIGQSSFTASGAATTQSGVYAPRGVTYDGSRLFVADHDNERILVYTGSSISNGMNANTVIGQTTFTAGNEARTQNRLSKPHDVAYDIAGDRLFVVDTTNQRVLVFSGGTLTNGMNANHVLGQINYTAGSTADTQEGFNSPRGIGYDPVSKRLYVSQVGSHRVSVFDVTSITNGEAAVDLLGQYDDDLDDPQPVYTKTAADNGPNRLGINPLNGMLIDTKNHRLFVADATNNRILVYNLDTDNILLDRIPDYVLGQSNFYTGTSSNTDTGLNSPRNMAYDEDRDYLFVASFNSARVVVFDVAAISNGEAAINIIGQPDFATTSVGVTASKMSGPVDVAFDADTNFLYVAQYLANRVTIYDVSTITDGEDAVYVLGQDGFTTSTGTNLAYGMRNPHGVALDSVRNRLFVAEFTNNRITSFDVSTITSGEGAQYVLGQSNLASSGSAVTRAGLNGPMNLAYDAANQRLFGTDYSNNRVLMYDVATIANGEDASYVLGQTDFTSNTAGTTQSTLSGPRSVHYDATNDYLYTMDRLNNRILIFDLSLQVAASATSSSSTSSRAVQSGGGRRNVDDLIRRALQRLEATAENSSSSPSNEEEPTSPRFSDVPFSSWFHSFVEQISSLGIVSGYEDKNGNLTGAFGPADPVTVGQTIKIALLVAGHELPIPAGIPQNPTATDWSAPYIALAESLNITLSSSDVTQNATRGEVIQALLDAFDIPLNTSTHPFIDLPANHPHAHAISTAHALDIVTGDTDAAGNSLNTVRPDDTINRAEVAALVVRMLEK